MRHVIRHWSPREASIINNNPHSIIQHNTAANHRQKKKNVKLNQLNQVSVPDEQHMAWAYCNTASVHTERLTLKVNKWAGQYKTKHQLKTRPSAGTGLLYRDRYIDPLCWNHKTGSSPPHTHGQQKLFWSVVGWVGSSSSSSRPLDD